MNSFQNFFGNINVKELERICIIVLVVLILSVGLWIFLKFIYRRGIWPFHQRPRRTVNRYVDKSIGSPLGTIYDLHHYWHVPLKINSNDNIFLGDLHVKALNYCHICDALEDRRKHGINSEAWKLEQICFLIGVGQFVDINQYRSDTESLPTFRAEWVADMYTQNLPKPTGLNTECVSLPFDENHRREQIISALLEIIGDIDDLLPIIQLYNSEIQHLNVLYMLKDQCFRRDINEINKFVYKFLPVIQQNALYLTEFLETLPVLKQNTNKSVTFCQQQVSSLLANGFLCTFPPAPKTTQSINFTPLLCASGIFKTVTASTKLQCFVNYFRRLQPARYWSIYYLKHRVKAMPSITFERRYIPNENLPDWENSSNKIGYRLDTNTEMLFNISVGIPIEHYHLAHQVLFSNSKFGKTFFEHNKINQEDMRIAACPELLVGRLFLEELTDNEALLITGATRYNVVKKNKLTLDWKADILDRTDYDPYFRKSSFIVALDPKDFSSNPRDQYIIQNILRELNKAYVGFYRGSHTIPPPIATGHWGCGRHKGNKQLKFIIQLMACTETGRDLIYCAYDDNDFQKDAYLMYDFCKTKEITVGSMYQCLKKYPGRFWSESLFEFIYKSFDDQPICRNNFMYNLHCLGRAPVLDFKQRIKDPPFSITTCPNKTYSPTQDQLEGLTRNRRLQAGPELIEEEEQKSDRQERADVQNGLQSEPKTQIDMQKGPHVQIDVQSEQQTQSDMQKEPDVQIDSKSEPKTQIDLQKGPHVQIDLQSEPKTQIDMQKEPDVQIDSKSEPKTQIDLRKGPHVQIDLQSEPKTQSDLQKEPEVQIDSKSEPKTQIDLQKGPHVQIDLQSEPKTQSDLQKEPDVQIDSKSEPKTQSDMQERPHVQISLPDEPETQSDPEEGTSTRHEPETQPDANQRLDRPDTLQPDLNREKNVEALNPPEPARSPEYLESLAEEIKVYFPSERHIKRLFVRKGGLTDTADSKIQVEPEPNPICYTKERNEVTLQHIPPDIAKGFIPKEKEPGKKEALARILKQELTKSVRFDMETEVIRPSLFELSTQNVKDHDARLFDIELALAVSAKELKTKRGHRILQGRWEIWWNNFLARFTDSRPIYV